jgi:V/A-type H+-transporting ATPase subunit I
MKFVNIMGPTDDIVRVKEQYLSKYEIQIEDAVKEMGATNKDITFFSEANPLAAPLKEIERIARTVRADADSPAKDMTPDESLALIGDIKARAEDFENRRALLQSRRNHLEELARELLPFSELDFPIEKLYNFSFIEYRFGRIPISGYKTFETYLYSNAAMLFAKIHTDAEYVWGVYFVPTTMHEKVDAIFASLYFERVELSEELHGKPQVAFRNTRGEIAALDAEINSLRQEEAEALGARREEIAGALRTIGERYAFNEMQKLVAKTRDGFYIIVGWTTAADAAKLSAEAALDDNITVIVKDESPNIKSKPPTKLSNFALFRPFEFYVMMYGLPSYNEIDPTPFFALTYTILFGMMFGDLGQGILLSAAGLLMYRARRMPVGKILAVVGLSSAVFGLLFGSVFGYEDIIEPLWISPLKSTDNIMLILVVAVGFGMVMNVSAMVIQMLNAAKRKDYGSLLFSPNGVSGVLFYVFVITLALSVYLGRDVFPAGIAALGVGLPLLFIAVREPLSNMLAKRRKLIHGSAGSFLLETTFELAEVLLSFFTNTLSFVRVGALALCHAGMMGVVTYLAHVERGSPGNIAVMIAGNLIVMCLEALLVSIQTLRLQYYEMFSRFYGGAGKAFKAFKPNSDDK